MPFVRSPAPHLHAYRAYQALRTAGDALARAAMAATAAAECLVRRGGRVLPTFDTLHAKLANVARTAMTAAASLPVGDGKAVPRPAKKRVRGADGPRAGEGERPSKRARCSRDVSTTGWFQERSQSTSVPPRPTMPADAVARPPPAKCQRYKQPAYGDEWLTPCQWQEVARKRGTSASGRRRAIFTRMRATAHVTINGGSFQPWHLSNHVCEWLGEAALFKEAADATAAAKVKTDAEAHAEAAWLAVTVESAAHAACVVQRAAQDKRQTAAALCKADRVSAAAAAAAPAAPPQLGAPGTPLPSVDRLRVFCTALDRAAAAGGRQRVRAPPTGATLVVSQGAYREATGAGMTRRAEAAAVAAWAATHPGVPREALTAGCSLKVATWGAWVVAASAHIARTYTDDYQAAYGAAATYGQREARVHALNQRNRYAAVLARRLTGGLLRRTVYGTKAVLATGR